MGTSHQAHVLPLIGYTADQGLFLANDAPKSARAYREFVGARFPAALVDAILPTYPATTDAEASAAALRVFGDSELMAAAVLTARSASTVGQTYAYRLSRVSPLSRSR